MALGMAHGGSAWAGLPRLTRLSFHLLLLSLSLFPPLLFTLFLLLSALSFFPLLFLLLILCLLPFLILFPILFFLFLFSSLLLPLLPFPSPPALLLLQKAENAEGQAPAIGPDGEVSPGSSHRFWDGREGATAVIPLQPTREPLGEERRPCPTGSIRILPPTLAPHFSQWVRGMLGPRIPNPDPSAPPTAPGRDKSDERPAGEGDPCGEREDPHWHRRA